MIVEDSLANNQQPTTNNQQPTTNNQQPHQLGADMHPRFLQKALISIHILHASNQDPPAYPVQGGFANGTPLNKGGRGDRCNANIFQIGMTSAMLMLLSLTSFSFQRLAAAKPTNNSQNPRIRYELKQPPPTGNPTQTSGAGNRGGVGNCPAVETPLSALVPMVKTTENQEFVWGRTTQDRPTLWVYVPYALTPDLPGELRLRETDAQGNQRYIPITRVTETASGVVGIRLPPGKALIPNQIYYWSFVVLCDPKDSSANQFVKAAIQRTEPDPALIQQLKTATPWQRAELFAKAGFWYDSLTQLAGLRRSRPQDVAIVQDWNALLAAGGLNELATQPIVRSP